jgi:hypothetical protein
MNDNPITLNFIRFCIHFLFTVLVFEMSMFFDEEQEISDKSNDQIQCKDDKGMSLM